MNTETLCSYVCFIPRHQGLHWSCNTCQGLSWRSSFFGGMCKELHWNGSNIPPKKQGYLWISMPPLSCSPLFHVLPYHQASQTLRYLCPPGSAWKPAHFKTSRGKVNMFHAYLPFINEGSSKSKKKGPGFEFYKSPENHHPRTRRSEIPSPLTGFRKKHLHSTQQPGLNPLGTPSSERTCPISGNVQRQMFIFP